MSSPVPVPGAVLSAGVVGGWRAELSSVSLPDDDVARWELLRGLEELKAAVAAAQARVTVAFEVSQRAAQEAAGLDGLEVGRGVAAQVALARRMSPSRGAREVGLARALVAELPHTLVALRAGTTTEWRAVLVARETACLSREDRGRVDAELAGRPGGFEALGDRATETAARVVGYRLDPYAAAARVRRAERDRRVSLRAAPDTMSVLTGLLPVRQGVAVWASLTRQADTARSAGDARSRGQIMADTLVERVTGQVVADAVPVEVQLVMTDRSLLGPRSEAGPGRGAGRSAAGLREAPAVVAGYGPVPAPVARSWVRESRAAVWVRRLYTDPGTGVLVGMDSRRRVFTGGVRAFVVARDQVCRTPWCGAPIRHVDHVIRAADGGPTSSSNGQGLCVACNLAREGPGWQVTHGEGHSGVITRTPTGHITSSSPPALTSPARTGPPRRATPRPRAPSHADIVFRYDLVLTA